VATPRFLRYDEQRPSLYLDLDRSVWSSGYASSKSHIFVQLAKRTNVELERRLKNEIAVYDHDKFPRLTRWADSRTGILSERRVRPLAVVKIGVHVVREV
jgi:hypothetical protein